jgi:exopolysaccharide transport family protein
MMQRKNMTPVQDSGPGGGDESGFDFREGLNFVWRQWRFIAGVTALITLIGAIYLLRQVPLYTASTQILLNLSKEKAAGQDVVLSDQAVDLPMIESQIAVIKSSTLLRRVVDKERLVNDIEFGPGPVAIGSAPGVLSSIKNFFSRGPEPQPDAEPAKPAGALDAMSPDTISTIENVKQAVGVTRAGQAYVLSVTFTSADPAKAARLANAVADAYVVDKLDARFDSARRASAWLSDRLVELRQQLRESEQAVAQFRTDNNLVQASPGASLNQEQLGQLNGRLVGARSETAEKKARLDLLQRVEAQGGNVSALPDVMNSGAIAELRKQENDVSRQEAELRARYSDRHPAVVNLRAQLADIHRAMAAEVARQTANIRNEYELAKARQSAVEKTLSDVTGKTGLDNAKAITLRELDRTAAVNKSLFEDFLQRARITQEQSTFEARDSRVISSAVPPPSPSWPKTNLVILGSLLLGLMAGVGGAYLVEKLNAGFTTPRQVEDLLELPLLTSISRMETRDLTADGAVLTIPQYPCVKPLSRFSEAIRTLRSAIQMSDVDNPPKVIQVTSTIPNEGKSTLSMTMAASAAQSGLKVLIIDCDLRHPSISRYFNGEKNIGLVDYLVGGAELEKVIAHDEGLCVYYLPAGGKTQNPPDLLGSEKFKLLIDQLRDRFDLIVIDTPPIGPVVDPLIVSHLVDKVVFVVRWAATAREMVAHSIERLSGRKKVAGVVFNHVIDAEAQKYGKYAYSYYYGGRYYKKYYNE